MAAVKDTENVLILVGVGIAAYLAYQAYQAVKSGVNAVGNAATTAGNAVGGSLFDFLNPTAAGSASTYSAALPNGQVIGVNSANVDANGVATVNGQQYQMYVDNSVTSGVNKTLVPLSQTQIDNSAAADQFSSF